MTALLALNQSVFALSIHTLAVVHHLLLPHHTVYEGASVMSALMDSSDNTLLHHAVMQNNVDAVRLLFSINELIDVNAINQDGQTPLQLNMMNHLSPEIRDILLEHGGMKKSDDFVIYVNQKSKITE